LIQRAQALDVAADPEELHYAREDGKLYDEAQFKKWYGSSWAKEWQATPAEQKLANDAKSYTLPEFKTFYGSSWAQKWTAAREAMLERVAQDGQTYTIAQFLSYYKDSWPEKWAAAKALPCVECCGGLNHASCDAKPTYCMWKWTGNWTTSCIEKPSVDELLSAIESLSATTPLEMHYAREDAKLYTDKQFKEWYGSAWKTEWDATPAEEKVARDGASYNLTAFLEFFGAKTGVEEWNAGKDATLERIAEDGKTYTIPQFFQYYAKTWPEKWAAAKSLPCVECCSGLNHAGCDAKPTYCQWKWTGDWKTSCILKTSAEDGVKELDVIV